VRASAAARRHLFRSAVLLMNMRSLCSMTAAYQSPTAMPRPSIRQGLLSKTYGSFSNRKEIFRFQAARTSRINAGPVICVSSLCIE
jgi:hypothetical protein